MKTGKEQSTMLLDTIKFVRGAVSRKNFRVDLKHFRIENKRITACDGLVALSAPIDIDILVNPKASTFHKALNLCEEDVKMSVTPSGKLYIRSGALRAYIDCMEDVYSIPEPKGEVYNTPENFIKILDKLSVLISEDASRLWSQGVLIDEGYIYVTNNVIFARSKIDVPNIPTIVIPKPAVHWLIKYGEHPHYIQTDGKSSATFHYSNGKWMYTGLFADEWPHRNLLHLFDIEYNYQANPETLEADLEALCALRESDMHPVFFRDNMLMTSETPESGFSIERGFQKASLCLTMRFARQIANVSTHLDPVTNGAQPRGFYGDNIEGVVAIIKR